jgi:vitamin B12 transporter
MNRYFIKKGIYIFFFFLASVCFCLSAFAQSEEEMQILRLFYKEKDLVVVSPTRYPKPISQAAENITVITAKDIEDMNAHTVAEVLNRVPGIFVSFNQGFGATSLLHIQGSEQRHVLVLLDGVPWNYLNCGSAETNSIPAGIIERIEIIKGPASSAWGSSLGGVINIVTKSAGNEERPTGSINASYGKSNTQDYKAQVASKAGFVGYYLFAGHQKSDGLRASRNFDNTSLYSKIKIPVSKDVNINFTAGYSEPQIGLGNFDFLSGVITSAGDSRTFFGTASLDALLNRDFSFNLSVYHFKQKSVIINNWLGLGSTGSAGELCRDTSYDEETTGGSGKLVWRHGIHTAVLGVDLSRGKLDQTITAGLYLQSPPYNVPPITKTHPDIDKRAIYINDTIIIDRWAITPGIRYDHNSITGSFVSPSLGVTYKLGEDSILRASVARGFTIPPLSWTSGGAFYLDPNPSLDPEEVWSYQAGAETGAINYLWLKATIFHHNLENVLVKDYSGGGQPIYINEGKVRRNGLEIEAETVPIYNVSLLGGFAYIDIDPQNEIGKAYNYTCNIGIRYDDKKSFRAELFGHYVWWNVDEYYMAEFDDFIWDLNLNKRIWSKEKAATELFLTAHNIFNGSQYAYGDSKNPETWIEAGLRFKF